MEVSVCGTYFNDVIIPNVKYVFKSKKKTMENREEVAEAVADEGDTAKKLL